MGFVMDVTRGYKDFSRQAYRVLEAYRQAYRVLEAYRQAYHLPWGEGEALPFPGEGGRGNVHGWR